jgi:hypothetical protein
MHTVEPTHLTRHGRAVALCRLSREPSDAPTAVLLSFLAACAVSDHTQEIANTATDAATVTAIQLTCPV